MASSRLEPSSTATGPDDSVLSTDTIFDTLSNRRRRYILQYLKRVDEPVTLRDLSEQLAAWEHGIDRVEVRPKERKRLYTALHQTHLPKMNGLGVLDYDRDRGLVSMNGPIDEFDIYFDMVGRAEIPWSQFYLGMGSLLTVLAGLAVLGFQPVAGLIRPGPVLVVSALFTSVALYHALRDRHQVLGSVDTPPESTAPSADLGADRESRRN